MELAHKLHPRFRCNSYYMKHKMFGTHTVYPSEHHHRNLEINLNTAMKQWRGLMAVNLNTVNQRYKEPLVEPRWVQSNPITMKLHPTA